MKPWHAFTLLLGATIIVPLFSQTTSSSLVAFNFPQKILGEPAGREWLEIPCHTRPANPVLYTTPPGKVLCLSVLRFYPQYQNTGNCGDIILTTDSSGTWIRTYLTNICDTPGGRTRDFELTELHLDDGVGGFEAGDRVTPSRLLTLPENKSLSMIYLNTSEPMRFYLCGWLEDA